jgi:hypothetical protein
LAEKITLNFSAQHQTQCIICSIPRPNVTVISDHNVLWAIILAANSPFPFIACTITKLIVAVGDAANKNNTASASPLSPKPMAIAHAISGDSISFHTQALIAVVSIRVNRSILNEPPMQINASGNTIWLKYLPLSIITPGRVMWRVFTAKPAKIAIINGFFATPINVGMNELLA